MPSNLNIKYGTKTGTGNTLVTPTTAQLTADPTRSDGLDISAGTIYAAKNSIGQIEMYIDTPAENPNNSERKRLDPKIFVGSIDDVNLPDTVVLSSDSYTAKNQKIEYIFQNYDAWMDTESEPTGVATTSNNGLMSPTQVEMVGQLISVLEELNFQIVTESRWNEIQTLNADSNSNNNVDLSNKLTLVLPDNARPSGENAAYTFVNIDGGNLGLQNANGVGF